VTPKEFVYWLQGFLEIGDPKAITEDQIKIIKDHMALALVQVTGNGPKVDSIQRLQELYRTGGFGTGGTYC
jgi:hypothetical protein